MKEVEEEKEEEGEDALMELKVARNASWLSLSDCGRSTSARV
jgi:hypothetical protein